MDEQTGTLNDDQHSYLENVITSSHHLLNLINNILDLNQLESCTMKIVTESLETEPFLLACLNLIREKAENRGFTVTADASLAPRHIQADGRKLKHALNLLLENAVKFTPDGGCVTLVAMEGKHDSLRAQPNELLFSVIDNGSGILKDDLERIINPFEQIESDISRTYQGAGLGLPLAAQVIKLHSGRFWVESAGLEQGSCFYFTIPITAS